ncbi:hypothetical protein Q057_05062 [Pseudomonas aeruginosa BL03]|nr:hypothetical protein Q057_05062 [Pseudomonas aeruginosa BL03]
MGSLDRQRWDALWQRLGGNPPADAFDALLAAYGGADRHYHSDRHILACLEHFDRWRQLALRPDLVELALWTHDLVYDTQRQDNEAASGAGLRTLRGGRPRRIRLGAGTAVPRRARQVAAPVAGATGAVPLRTAAATLGGRRPRQPARCPGAPGTAGLSRTGKFLRAA